MLASSFHVDAQGLSDVLAQVPRLSEYQSTQIKAVCLDKYGGSGPNADNAKIARCSTCGAIAVSSKIKEFNATTCGAVATNTAPFNGNADPANDARLAGEFCTNTCSDKSRVEVPNLAALVDGTITVTNPDTAEYSLEGKGSGSDMEINAMGLTCGDPDNPSISQCCEPSKFANKCVLSSFRSDIKKPGFKKSYFIPVVGQLNAAKDAISVVGNTIKNEGIDFLCALIVDKVERINTGIEREILDPSKGVLPTDGSCLPEEGVSAKVGAGGACVCVRAPAEPLTELAAVDSLTGGAAKPLLTQKKARDVCSASGGESTACVKCMTTDRGYWTALGCVPVQPETFIQDKVLPIGLGLAGATALLTIIYAAYLVQSSQGNPEKLKKARSYMTSALVGLLMVILSVFILQFIGANILGLPDISGTPMR